MKPANPCVPMLSHLTDRFSVAKCVCVYRIYKVKLFLGLSSV